MKKRIYLDAGHGGRDSGAVGHVVERDVNIKVVKYMKTHLEENYDCMIYMDITDDSTANIAKRANKWLANLFVSIHFNAGGGDGFEALVYSTANQKLGQCFEKHVKTTGQNSRGVKYRPDLNVLRLTNMPAILNEIAFVDNAKDIKDWNEDHELKKMGVALAEAAAEWLDLPAKAGKYKVLQDMNFRKTATLAGEKLAVIKKGTVLTGTVDKDGWLQTIHDGKTGYVRQKGEKVYCQKV